MPPAGGPVQARAELDPATGGALYAIALDGKSASQIASVGDAMPVYYAGVIDAVRDEPRSIRTAMFTPKNIAAGSLSIEYMFPSYDTPDHVIVEYTDSTTFKPAEVACVLNGSTRLRASRLKMFGCTDRNPAWRHGIRLAAANRDRGHSVSFRRRPTAVRRGACWGQRSDVNRGQPWRGGMAGTSASDRSHAGALDNLDGNYRRADLPALARRC